MDIHGFASQGYLRTDEYNYVSTKTKGGTFDFGEIGVNFTSQVSNSIRVGAQLLSRRMGDDGESKVGIAWAHRDYQQNRYFGIRSGKIRMPVGPYNQTRDIDAVRNTVFLPQSTYLEMDYTFLSAIYGLSIYGAIQLPSNSGELEYEIFGGRGEDDENSFLVKRSAQEATDSLDGTISSANMNYKHVYGGAMR